MPSKKIKFSGSKISVLFTEFFESEKASGIILLLCTLISLALANSAWAAHYNSIWDYEIQGHSVTHWINDGLMAIFFLLIGLELEREVYAGTLSSFKDALFPVIAATGGMIVPAVVYFMMNRGTETLNGTGIPMATDIAFALGILSLLGKRVPLALKIFLTALAVIDDLGAILCIAFFYTKTINFVPLGISLGIFALLLLLNKLKVRNLIPYLIGGVGMWYFMLHSGVHATISGVLLAFAIPFGNERKKSASFMLQHNLHIPVAYIILPVFALANTCITFPANWKEGLLSSNSLGIFAGLVAGKPLGVLLATGIAVMIGLCKLPDGLKWKHIAGAGMLAGIGFTMSVFITLLAFQNEEYIVTSKIAILFSSLIAALIGLVFLMVSTRKTEDGIVQKKHP